MKVIDSGALEFEAVTHDGAQGAGIKELITLAQGAENFAMRLFEIAPGGNTPFHKHDWEHEVFVVSGCGEVRTDAGQVPVKAGCAAFVPGGEQHSFANTGDEPMRFICVIPVEMPCCR
jgi:quercetin dioxygenase-like cupin family protein